MKTATLVFPGSNCDADCYHAAKRFSKKVDYVWHKNAFNEKDYDFVIVPGGFSYGDYLRCGAIARFSPVMQSVQAHAKRGGYILGICNGFQILTESHILPGALIRNTNLQFICNNAYLRVETNETPYTTAMRNGDILTIPIAHGEGNYRADEDVLKRLNDEGRVAFRYVTKDGVLSEAANPNGSAENIAGILSENKRVLGMMPHPERVVEAMVGGVDGEKLFKSVFQTA